MIDEVGDPGGTPVVYFHGGGDSRLTRHPDDSIAAELGIRLLAFDRSGKARRFPTLRAWAEATLATIEVERFATLGWSAGGPHALALAAVAPERVTRVAVVGSMPPPDALDSGLARRPAGGPPGALRAAGRGARARAVGEAADAADRQPRDRRGVRARPRRLVPRGRSVARVRARVPRPSVGVRASASIEQPVTLWWGDRDTTCLPSIGELYAERLPNAELRLVDGTHQLLFARWREILASAAA